MTITSPAESTPDTVARSGRTRGRTDAAEQARRRRQRRHEKLATTYGLEPLLDRARRSARQLPFVVLLVVLLGGGLAGVLWLNTMTDEAGIKTNEARRASAQLQLQIEGVSSDIAARNATPAIAQAAQSLGMVPAGDAAILLVPDPADPAATPTVLGSPTAVVDPAVIAAQEAAAAAAAEQAAADAAAAAAASSAAQAAADAQAAAAQAAAAAAAATPPADPNAAQPTTIADVTPVDPNGAPADVATMTGAAG